MQKRRRRSRQPVPEPVIPSLDETIVPGTLVVDRTMHGEGVVEADMGIWLFVRFARATHLVARSDLRPLRVMDAPLPAAAPPARPVVRPHVTADELSAAGFCVMDTPWGLWLALPCTGDHPLAFLGPQGTSHAVMMFPVYRHPDKSASGAAAARVRHLLIAGLTAADVDQPARRKHELGRMRIAIQHLLEDEHEAHRRTPTGYVRVLRAGLPSLGRRS